MRIETRTQAEAALASIRRLRQELVAARRDNANLSFSVTNISIDEKARNPAHRIYYYERVDQGRDQITAGANRTNIYPRLHFMTDGGWVVTRHVRAAPARYIGQAAQELLPGALADARASVAGINNPAEAVRADLAAMKSAVLRVYRQATIDVVEHQNTKAQYGVVSIPLAEGFRIVQNGQIEELS